MWWLFKKSKKKVEVDINIWKIDFSDCVTADYLPTYSVCQCQQNNNCRFIARYAGMILCSNPEHKNFIPEGAELFDPQKGQYLD